MKVQQTKTGIENKVIRVNILNDEYKVVVCWGTTGFITKIARSYHYTDNEFPIDGRGKCYYHKGSYPMVVLPRQPKTSEEIGTLAHEAVHAIDYIFGYLEETRATEIHAHSVGAIVRKVLYEANK